MADWAEIEVKCAPEAIEAVSRFFLELGAKGTEIRDPQRFERHGLGSGWDLVDESSLAARDEGWAVKAYFPFAEGRRVADETEAFLRRLPDFGLNAGVAAEVGVRRVSDEDWEESWKSFYPVLHIGRRFVIRPSWLPYASTAGEVVVDLDPGMAFGTGMHPTTALALEMLEAVAGSLGFGANEGPRVLDVGTGSGILAVAAAKLGAATVLAVDADPTAVAVAKGNIAANGAEALVEARHLSVDAGAATGLDEGACYDLIMENTLAEVIAANLPALARLLCPQGRVILSGVVSGKEGLVQEAVSATGLRVVARNERDGWMGFVLRGPEATQGPSVVGHFLVGADDFDARRERLVLPGELARHVARSLRARSGEYLTVALVPEADLPTESAKVAEDAEDADSVEAAEYLVRLDEVGPARVIGAVVARRRAWTEPVTKVTLCQGLPKADKMDLIIQKAVELGVNEIAPVITERAVPDLTSAKAPARVSRWRRIAREAAQQSRRARVPHVRVPASLRDVLRNAPPGCSIVLWEGESAPLQEIVSVMAPAEGNTQAREVFLFVGPEGGFSAAEMDILHGAGALSAALGPRIMRTETAAVVGLAALMFSLGELGPRIPPPWLSTSTGKPTGTR